MAKVQLVALTKPTTTDAGNAEQFIAYCARVSNPSNQMNHGTAPKLLSYLASHNHWSPFEMAHAVLEIVTTRDIARQILRHRSFSFQEFSQRYGVVENFPVLREARLQDTKNRQSSIEVDDHNLEESWLALQCELAEKTTAAYKWALDNGIAKEVARVVLPEGMTESRLYVSGTIRSWIHYINLRVSNGTQKEHREVAAKCRDVLVSAMPALSEVFNG